MDYIIQKTARKVKLKKQTNKIVFSIPYIHEQKLKYFEELQSIILPKKIKDIDKIKKQIEIKDPLKKLKAFEIIQKQNELKKIYNEIEIIKNKEEEIDYHFKTSKILSKYYSEYHNEYESTENLFTVDEKKNIIIEFFQVLNLDVPAKFQSNLHLFEDSQKCKSCNESDTMIESEMSTCKNCGVISDKIISHKLSYKEIQDNYSYTPSDLFYKRIDYFKQMLNQFQGNEQTDIPQSVIDAVLLQLKVERIDNLSKLNNSLVRRLLKKTSNSKYYEHITYIIRKINGKAPLTIPVYIEEKLINMFTEVNNIWEHVKCKDRKSFFSYPYLIHKLCQILELNEYLPYFQLLKSREKLHKQDIMWKKVIDHIKFNPLKNDFLRDVNWRFISST